MQRSDPFHRFTISTANFIYYQQMFLSILSIQFVFTILQKKTCYTLT